MNTPTEQDPAYEYCLGSEAEAMWGPKTKDMEFKDSNGYWIPIVFGSRYEEDTLYRRKRQTTVQDGEEWIEISQRKPTMADVPVWVFGVNGGIVYTHAPHYANEYTHWKPVKLPAPPKPKHKTQEEMDEEVVNEIVKSTDFNPPSTNDCFRFRAGCRAALAWERSRGKEDGK